MSDEILKDALENKKNDESIYVSYITLIVMKMIRKEFEDQHEGLSEDMILNLDSRIIKVKFQDVIEW